MLTLPSLDYTSVQYPLFIYFCYLLDPINHLLNLKIKIGFCQLELLHNKGLFRSAAFGMITQILVRVDKLNRSPACYTTVNQNFFACFCSRRYSFGTPEPVQLYTTGITANINQIYIINKLDPIKVGLGGFVSFFYEILVKYELLS